MILRIALAQMNPVVGDLEGNTEKILDGIGKARRRKADIVAFPELAVTGYPPEDLLHKPQFISDTTRKIRLISSRTRGIAAVVGFVDRGKGTELYNAAAVLSDGRHIDSYHKVLLPNYGVFDEYRYFKPGKRAPVYRLGSVNLGINICEDIWHRDGPARHQADAGAEIIVNINASPYERGKPALREKVLFERSRENVVVIAYLNAVGGQDELVFDGFSMVVDHRGRLLARARQFEEELLLIDVDLAPLREYRMGRAAKRKAAVAAGARKITVPCACHPRRSRIPPPGVCPAMEDEPEVYRALLLGTADYVRKNGFKAVLVGLSGGIDSSLVATIAVDALGKDQVKGLFMPSRYSSQESREDAFALAANLGILIREIPIEPIREAYRATLEPFFRGIPEDVTEENLQARIRGNLLMAFSNKFGWLVLTTGNKSEMSVGYATLYGDMAGGFAVIKDVPKTLVYGLCSWRNGRGDGAVIPERVLWKEPTAELRPGQRDTDSLPPYEVLDPLLKAYVEEERSFDEILALGGDRACAEKVIRMVDISEYKRRQSPPGIKITMRAFGRDRRVPITNRYRSY